MIAFRDELEEFARYRDETEFRRRRGGRPKLPPALKTEPFSLRLTPAERDLVATAALVAGEGYATATWARVALLDAARRVLTGRNN